MQSRVKYLSNEETRMMAKISVMRKKLDSRQQLFQEKDLDFERIQAVKINELQKTVEKRRLLQEENERKRLARREREMTTFQNAIEVKKREIEEKLRLRQQVIIAREFQLQTAAKKAEEIRLMHDQIKAKVADHLLRKQDRTAIEEDKRR